VREEKESGMAPLRILLLMLKYCKVDSDPRELGIVPDRTLDATEKRNSLGSVLALNVFGIVPARRCVFKVRLVRRGEESSNQVVGIEPVSC